MKRRQFIKSSITLSAGLINPAVFVRASLNRERFEIVVYEAEKILTPHIDQLAADGIRFASAYATAATCTLSCYSLLQEFKFGSKINFTRLRENVYIIT